MYVISTYNNMILYIYIHARICVHTYIHIHTYVCVCIYMYFLRICVLYTLSFQAPKKRRVQLETSGLYTIPTKSQGFHPKPRVSCHPAAKQGLNALSLCLTRTTWGKLKKHEAAQVLSNPFIFPTTELSYPNRKKFGFEILRQLTRAQPVPNP